MNVDVTAWEAAGLYDPAAPDAEARAALIEYLVSLGLSVDDIASAARDRRLDRVAADHMLWHDAGPTLTVRDIAARSAGGLDESLIRAIVRASGSPDPLDAPLYREAHIALFESFSLGAQIFGNDAILQFTRVLGACAARVAEAAISSFAANVSPRLRESDASELERVQQYAEAVRAFTVVPVAMDILIREHFVAAIRRLALVDTVEGGAAPVAIGFVDLVASTELSQVVGPETLAHALGDFENAALDAAVEHDCRVVKLIGDGVMIAGLDATAVVDVVVGVLAYVDGHAVLGTAHAGVASGLAVARDGDYFGPVVNLASRLAGVAPPGEIYVTAEVRDVVSPVDFRLEAAGDCELKGFAEPVEVTRLRPN